MKGITPVIAIILLLLITISMVGFAFVWFSRVTSQAGQQIENQTLQQIGAAAQKISIDGFNPGPSTIVYLKNTGSATVQLASISVYVASTIRTCTTFTSPSGAPITSLAPGAVGTCTFSGAACSAGQTIRVSAPGGEDIVTCT